MRALMALAVLILFSHIGEVAAVSNKAKLQEIERKRAQAQGISEELKKEIEGLVEEQRALKQDLVSLATELQKQEQKLTKTKQEEAETSKQLEEAITSLDARRSELEAMIQAAVRMSQVPPQAMVMMPEMNENTMQISRTMRIMADTLNQRANELREEITKLKTLRVRMKTLREKTEKQLASVKAQRGQVSGKLAKRKKLTRKLNKQLGIETSRMRRLAKEASDVKQLIATIRKSQQQPKITSQVKDGIENMVSYVESAIAGGGSKGKMRSFTSQKGKLRAPSAGKIVGRYKKNGQGERSKGLTIQTVSDASVSAPFDGKVAYVGQFRGYGNMVILKHAQDYYTLMAGLKNIQTTEGEILLEGEPIGSMGGNSRKLYVELRKGSEPINPNGWFVGL